MSSKELLQRNEKGNNCNILMAIIVLYIISCLQHDQQWNVSSTFLSAVLLLQGMLAWLFAHGSVFVTSHELSFRQKTSSGIFMVMLVPVVMMSEIIACDSLSGNEILMKELWLSLVSVSAAVVRLMVHVNSTFEPLTLIMLILIGTALSAVFGWIIVLITIEFSTMWKGLELVPRYLPNSFTFGELATALQLLFVWINRIIFHFLMAPAMPRDNFELSLMVNAVVIAVVAATTLGYLTGSYVSLWRFSAIYVMTAILSLTFLHVSFGENPLIWLLSFVLDSCVKIYLLTSWILLFLVTVIWTVSEGLMIQSQTKSKSQNERTSYHPETAKESGVTPTTRKVFHVFIVLVYIPGLLYEPHLLLIASAAAFGLFIILEAARTLHVPWIGEQLDGVLRTFIDEKDQGLVFLTHIYLLLGLSLPLWISHRLFSVETATVEMYSGVLALGIGDTIACVAGRAMGRISWPGSNKTVEGTFLSILAQMSLVLLGICTGFIVINNLWTVFIGVILTALVEAFTDQIDNLVLPLTLYPILCVQ